MELPIAIQLKQKRIYFHEIIIFVAGGGLSAVIWTDFVQTILMIIGAVWLMVLSFREVGGYEELIEKYR